MMRSHRRIQRRSFLLLVAGAGAIGGAVPFGTGRGLAQGGASPVRPPRPSPITDGDKNPADVTGPRGCTDYDSGARSDPPQGGRGNGVSDRASRPRAIGSSGDRAGCGRVSPPGRR